MAEGEYEELTSPDDYENVNEWTNKLFGKGGIDLQGLVQGGQAGMEAGINTANEAAGNFNPYAGSEALFSMFGPQAMGMITDATSPYAQQQQQVQQRAMEQAADVTLSKLSGINSLNSGYTPKAVARELGNIGQQGSLQLSGMRQQMLSPLLQQGLSGLNQGFAQQAGFGIEAGLGGAQLYGNQMNNAMGVAGQLGAPTYVAPDQEYNPSDWETWGADLAGAGIGALGTIAGDVLGALL
jgi:hypothetical protein